MKKFLKYTVATVLVLALVAYIGVAFFLGSIVKAGVNRVGPKLTQTKVELAGAHISPLSGSGTLSGLSVGNPAGWSDGNAFYLGSMHIDVKPLSLLGDHIVVNDLDIDRAEFNYETKIVSSNINDLLKNIEARTGGDKEATAANGKQKKFEVHHLRLTNAKVTVGLGATALPLSMPPIEMTDLGTAEGGITAEQLAFAVMRKVTSGVVAATTQAAGQIGSTGGAAAVEKAKKAGESIKKLFGSGK
ncbi:MAG: hypothetical protein JWM88_736 [Verrucomicrobia bacterium]|nr:hypothetical protein [Verrucomicrobiota bacterium]